MPGRWPCCGRRRRRQALRRCRMGHPLRTPTTARWCPSRGAKPQRPCTSRWHSKAAARHRLAPRRSCCTRYHQLPARAGQSAHHGETGALQAASSAANCSAPTGLRSLLPSHPLCSSVSCHCSIAPAGLNHCVKLFLLGALASLFVAQAHNLPALAHVKLSNVTGTDWQPHLLS